VGIEGRIVVRIDGLKTFLRSGTQPFKFGSIFKFALFQEPKSLAYDTARVAESARLDTGFDEAI
jgi:hypothetical protein